MRLTYDKNTRTFHAAVKTRSEWNALMSNPKWVLHFVNTFTTSDIQEAARFRKYADQIAERLFTRAFVKTYPLPPKRLPSFLDPWQREGVEWALTRSRSYLAHAPGAGKTLDAIVISLYAQGPGQTVFIVPPTLTVNWENEIVKFLDRMRPDEWPSITVVPESKHQESIAWRSDYIIVPDSMLIKAWVRERLEKLRIKVIAIDEASRFKEPTSNRTIALFGGRTKDFKTRGLVRSARHAVLLDGSPMPNRHMELWAPTFAMCPEAIDFMSQRQFGFRYCGAEMNDYGQWEFKHATKPDELRSKLQKKFMHVVTEERLGHAARVRSLVFMGEDPRTPEVKSWERQWIKRLEKNPDIDLSEDAPKRAKDERGTLATLRKKLGVSKIEWAAKYVMERVDNGEAVLVFAWHREVVFGLAQAMRRYKPGVIMGGTKNGEREEFLTSFQGGKRDLLIMNIAAGGRGHNIQRADRIVFVEPSWTDEQNKQCEKRASRRGRSADLPVKSDYLVIRDSLDERIMSSNFTKERRVKRVIG